MSWMRLLRKPLIALVGLAGLLGAAEIVLRVGGRLLNREPLLIAHHVVGWRTRGDLDVTRINSDGQTWSVRTYGNSRRITRGEERDGKRVQILGDSFAFGEGVNIEQRFDSFFDPSLRIANGGTMGYGTEQALLQARPYFGLLRKGDVVLVVFYRNDFDDVLRHRHLAFKKPVLERRDNHWDWRLPAANSAERLLTYSYLMLASSRLFNRPEPQPTAYAHATDIIWELFTSLRGLKSSGVRLVLAHHGRAAEPQIPAQYSGALFCDLVDLCIDLDAAGVGVPAHLLRDGHWNATGHRAAGEAIRNALKPLLDRP